MKVANYISLIQMFPNHIALGLNTTVSKINNYYVKFELFISHAL